MLSIIIPTLNEEEGIAKTICSIPKAIRSQAELIVVDFSTDLTPVIAKELGAKVITTKKKGKGLQMRQAAAESKGDILIFMDGDGEHGGSFIPKMLKKLENADLVLGCCNNFYEGEDASKFSALFQFFTILSYPMSQTLKMPVSDPLSGFRAIRRKDWESLDLKSEDFDIEMEINISAMRKGFKVEEIKIPNVRRSGGYANSKFLKSPKMWVKIFKMLVDYSREEKIAK